jgi:hypothetical protein
MKPKTRELIKAEIRSQLTDKIVQSEIVEARIKLKYGGLDVVREVCKLPGVRARFALAKSFNTPFWPEDGCDLNPLQTKFLQWIKFYSSIDESIERPPDRVVYNDKMLGGWLEEQQRKMSDRYEENWRGDTNKVAKSALDHQEVFSFEDDPEAMGIEYDWPAEAGDED